MKKINKKQVLLVSVFLIGMAFILFPLVSQWVYYRAAQHTVEEFTEQADQIDNTEVNRRIQLAHAYNETVDLKDLEDPFTELQQEGRAEYARMLEVNEQVGLVTIPTISARLPVFAGTSEYVLQKGVGHLEGTSLPVGGESTHSVITAHRGLPTARLFTDLDKMEVGDIFYFQNIKESLAYQVDHIEVIEPDDFDAIEEGEDYLTLLTCTPYMVNSHRLIVRGKRIPMPEEDNQVARNGLPCEFVIPILLIVLLLLYFIYQKKKAE